MKKYSFWLNLFLLTFLLGIGAVVFWFTMTENTLEAVKPPPLLISQNCVEPPNFPGLAQKILFVEKGKGSYFPKGVFAYKKENFAGKEVFEWKEQDDFLNDGYGKYLKAMQEKSLLDITDTKVEVYRFLWLRSFNHPIFVRIERNQNEIILFTKEFNSDGNNKAKKFSRDFKRNLSETEWCGYLRLLQKANYWNLPTEEDFQNPDGAQWILESVKDGRYHVVDRQSPNENDYREACIYLLKLSGVDTDKLGDDLY